MEICLSVSRNDSETQAMSLFRYENHEVRTVMKSGKPWFVAKDVCDVLEIGNSRMATNSLDEDEKDWVSITDAIGRDRETSIVSESRLYSLILHSRKSEAKKFRRWVTHDVLPAIRKEKQMIENGIENNAENPMEQAKHTLQTDAENVKMNELITSPEPSVSQ